MKYVLTFVGVLILGLGSYWWFMAHPSTPQPVTQTTPVTNATSAQPTSTTSANGVIKTYQNDTWGIAFEYPNDWEIRQPAFRSASSLFNLAIESSVEKKLPDPVFINITPKEWIVNALKQMRNRGVKTQDETVAEYNALKLEDFDMGIPEITYLILVNDSYWIDISGKKEYEDVLNQVIKSFKVRPVKIPSLNQ